MTAVDRAIEQLSLVPGPSAEYLNPRQLADYRAQREACLRWFLTYRKNPKHVEGYAFEMVKARSYRMDHLCRGGGGNTAGTPHSSRASRLTGGCGTSRS